MIRRSLAAAAALAASALLLTGCIGSTPVEPTPTPTATSTLGNDSSADTFDEVGQAADDGTFEPLVVPAGMPHGAGTAVPAQWLTKTGDAPQMGQTFVVQLPTQDSTGTPTVLLSVDSVTEPIVGDERSWVLQSEGSGVDGDLVVQKVTLRVREVANDGDTTAWNITAALEALNNAGNAMPLRPYEESPFGCQGAGMPFAEHGLETNDTVQVCMYALGSFAFNPSAWLNGVRVLGVVDGSSSPVVVISTVQQPHGDAE